MNQIKNTLLVLSGLLLAFSVNAAQLTQEAPEQNPITKLVRGANITVGELSTIAEVSSARNQKGDPVELDSDATYQIASFTQTTLSIAPPAGSKDDVITLDLFRNQK